jgi:hypothetical protein
MKQTKLEQEIMKKIDKDEIKMKPKWQFLMKTLGLRGALFLNILIAALFISGMIYFASINTPLELWDYGDIGIQIFFEDFPYFWLIIGLILIIGSGILLSKVGENYKKTTRKILLITIVLVVLISLLMLTVKNYFGLKFL